MAENQAGITAFVTAYARAYHATHESPKVFDDFLADCLFTSEEHAYMNQNLAQNLALFDPDLAAEHPDPAEALALGMQLVYEPVTLSRSRFCEDCLAAALLAGVRQYVILGAGFDTFAFRSREMLKEGLRVFELDHPVTQGMKRERVAKAGWQVPANLTFAPIDFTTQSLAEVLPAAGYDPAQPGFFAWLGVTFYLTREDTFATLRAIRQLTAPGSQVVFDFIGAASLVPGQSTQKAKAMSHIVRQAGEPMKSAFFPAALPSELGELGWQLAETLSPEQIQARFFAGRTDRLHAFEHTWLARIRC